MAAELDRLVVRLEGDLSSLRSELAAGVRETHAAGAAMAGAFDGMSGAIEHVTGSAEIMGRAIGALSIGALVEGAKKALEYAHSIGDMAANAGVSAESLQKLRYAAGQLGLTNEQLDGSLTKLNINIGEASIKGGDAEKKFSRLGISLKELRENSVEQNFYRIVDALGDVKNVTERTALAFDIFGKQAGRSLGKVLEAGADAMRNMGEEGQRLGAVLSDELVKKAEEADNKLRGLNQTLKTQLSETMIALAPIIVTVTTALTEFVVGLKNAVSADYSALGKFANEIAATEDKIQGLQRQLKELSFIGLISPGQVEEAKNRIAALEQYLDELKTRQREAMGFGVKAAAPFVGPPAPQKLTEAEVAEAKKAADERVKYEERVQKFIAESRAIGLEQFRKNLDEEIKAEEKELALRLRNEKTVQDAMRQSAQLQARLAAGVIGDFMSGKQGVTGDDARRAQQVQEEQQKKAEKIRFQELQLQLKDAHAGAAQLAQIARDHQAVLTNISQEGADARRDIARIEHEKLLHGTEDALGSLASLMNSHSRKAFELGKAAAIANTVIHTAEAAMGAYASLASIPYIGPALGAAAAAAAIAAGLVQIQQIKSTQFGGGGSAASSGGGGGGGGAAAAAGSSGGSASAQRSVLINLTGQNQTYTADQVRDLISAINGEQGDGARVAVVTGGNY